MWIVFALQLPDHARLIGVSGPGSPRDNAYRIDDRGGHSAQMGRVGVRKVAPGVPTWDERGASVVGSLVHVIDMHFDHSGSARTRGRVRLIDVKRRPTSARDLHSHAQALQFCLFFVRKTVGHHH